MSAPRRASLRLVLPTVPAAASLRHGVYVHQFLRVRVEERLPPKVRLIEPHRPRPEDAHLWTHRHRFYRGSSALTNPPLIIWPLYRTVSNSTHLLTTTLGFIMINKKKGGYLAGLSFTPQTEHLPSAVIFGCSLTSLPHIPHLGISFTQQLCCRRVLKTISY